MAIGDCIIYESVMVNNTPYQQLSNLNLQGISTNDATSNTDNGLLYGSFTFSSPTYTLHLYSDSAKSSLVATASSSTLGVTNIAESNSSGLTGTINFAQYSANDNLLYFVCCISRDKLLPLANLEGLSDYDDTVGFAFYHLQAFQAIKEYVMMKEKADLWNPTLIDSNQINGGLGGYDLGRLLNWQQDALKEASIHYAFWHIAERQAITGNSIFKQKAEDSRTRYYAHLRNANVQVDNRRLRVEEKSRTLRVLKTGRC